MKWLYQSGVASFHEMTNLSKNFRKEIDELARIGSILIETIQESRDGQKKSSLGWRMVISSKVSFFRRKTI